MKERSGITPQEEKIKKRLRAEISAQTEQTDCWKKIAAQAYEPREQVKPNRLPFIFPAVCAALTIAVLAVVQVSSGEVFDFAPATCTSKDDSDQAQGGSNSNDMGTAEAAAGTVGTATGTAAGTAAAVPDKDTEETYFEESADIPEILSAVTRVSKDESGLASSSCYSLDYSVYFPNEDSKSSFGSIYTYLICDGKVIAVSEDPVYGRSGKTNEINSLLFELDPITSSYSPELTIISCFERKGSVTGSSADTAVKSISVTNPNFSTITASTAYQNDSALIEYRKTDSAWEQQPWTVFYDGGQPYLSYDIDRNYTDSDLILITQTPELTEYVSQYMSKEDAMSGYNAEISLSDVGTFSESETGFAIAAAIPRNGGEAEVSRIFTAKELNGGGQ